MCRSRPSSTPRSRVVSSIASTHRRSMFLASHTLHAFLSLSFIPLLFLSLTSHTHISFFSIQALARPSLCAGVKSAPPVSLRVRRCKWRVFSLYPFFCLNFFLFFSHPIFPPPP